MTAIRIIVGHQDQANEPIYLHSNGTIICGNYQYSGRCKQKFRDTYNLITDLVDHRQPDGTIDVSKYRFWNAMDIYEEYIAKPWKKTLGARTLERLSNETLVSIAREEILAEFKRAIAAKWRKVFLHSDINDPARPTQGWHLCMNPRIK